MLPHQIKVKMGYWTQSPAVGDTNQFQDHTRPFISEPVDWDTDIAHA